jgi:hypothetical protein
LQQSSADALLLVVLPLAALGLVLGRRNRAMLIVAANVGTVIFSGAFFFGEARYNVPYAPFALLLSVVGVYELLSRVWRFVRRRATRRRMASPVRPYAAPSLEPTSREAA